MIPIYTKKIKNKWVVFSTFDGQDFSYSSMVKNKAKEKMKKRLTKSNLIDHALWMKEKKYEPDLHTTKNNWRPPKIDNNPFG